MPSAKIIPLSDKIRFVLAAREEGANVRELCRRFSISPPTAYKLLHRYEAEGEAGLVPRSRGPRTSPHRTPIEIEQAVVQIRGEHPRWGTKRIREALRQQGYDRLPALSTIMAILYRYGSVTRKPRTLTR